MKITGTLIPFGKINKAKNKWGIKNDMVEVNRIITQAVGKPIKVCTEAFSNVSGAHACDLHPKATIGTITSTTYDPKTNTAQYEGDITDMQVVHLVKSGQIKRNTSPHIKSEYQDEDGYIHETDFECLTLVNTPAFEECTFSIVHTAEGEQDLEEEEPKANPLNLAPKTVPPDDVITIKKEDLAKMIAEQVANALKGKEPEPKKDPEPEPKPEPKKDPEPQPQYLTPEQAEEIWNQKRLDMEKDNAVNEYRLVSNALGFKTTEETVTSMKALPLEEIRTMTSNLRAVKDKIPVDKEKSKKPTYYDPITGTGGMDGSSQFTVGYMNDDGTWSTEQ